MLIKRKIKLILTILITSIVVGSISVFAVIKYYARDISYTPINENFKKENGEPIDNVEDALNELYKTSYNNIISVMYNGGHPTLDIIGKGYSEDLTNGYIKLDAGAGTFTNYAVLGPVDLTKFDLLEFESFTTLGGTINGLIDVSKYSGLYYIGFNYVTDSKHNETNIIIGKEPSNAISIHQISYTSGQTPLAYIKNISLIDKSSNIKWYE